MSVLGLTDMKESILVIVPGFSQLQLAPHYTWIARIF